MSSLLARCFLLILFVSAPALARSPELDPATNATLQKVEEGIGRVATGAWATYRVTDDTGARTAFVRWAVVGEAIDEHRRPARWVELELGPHSAMKAPLLQLRFLMSTRAEGRPSITRLYVGMGPEKVREVAPDAISGFQRAPTKPRPPGSAPQEMSVREGRAARLNTSAGTLEATPTEILYRQTVVQRIWMSPQVPFLGLARLEVPAIGQQLEVHDFGLDAKPRIVLPDPSEPKITRGAAEPGAGVKP